MEVPQMFPWLGDEEVEAVSKTIRSGWITEGPQSKEFSAKLNDFIGTKFGVFAPNGTLALFLGLLALGIKEGDEVIVPDSTFIASANAVVLTGATPVFCDVRKGDFQIDITLCEKLVTARTKAIMPVHLFGSAADMRAVIQFASKHGLKVIEDAAQGIGVHYEGQHVGTFGDIGCFSFFADKTLTTGEGGYVTCKSEEVYEQLLYLRNQGRLDRGSFIHPRIGYNFRMTDLQASIGLVQFGRLAEIIRRKREILGWYKEAFRDISDRIEFLTPGEGVDFVPFRVVIFVEDAKKFMDHLSLNHIQPRSFFFPLHAQPCFEYLKGEGKGADGEQCPNATWAYQHGVCLPVFPQVSRAQIEYIGEIAKKFFSTTQ